MRRSPIIHYPQFINDYLKRGGVGGEGCGVGGVGVMQCECVLLLATAT